MHESSQRAPKVSKRLTTRQTSQAGKKDPRISKEGARVQPTHSIAASNNTEIRAVMGVSFSRWVGSHRQCETRDPPARPTPVFAPEYRLSAPGQGPSGRW